MGNDGKDIKTSRINRSLEEVKKKEDKKKEELEKTTSSNSSTNNTSVVENSTTDIDYSTDYIKNKFIYNNKNRIKYKKIQPKIKVDFFTLVKKEKINILNKSIEKN